MKFHEKFEFHVTCETFHDFCRNIVGQLEIMGNMSSDRYPTYIWDEDEEILTYVVCQRADRPMTRKFPLIFSSRV